MVESNIERGKFKSFYWTAPGTDIIQIHDENFKKHPYFKKTNYQAKFLQQFINNELNLETTTKPANNKVSHIELMKRHDLVDYCDVSEKGHMKWYPKGMVMRNLMLDYAKELAYKWGALEMGNPLIMKADNELVMKLMGEFHENNYTVDGGRGKAYLRYASDPLGFPFMQNLIYSEKQSPLKVYEEAYCFRNELEGSVSGLKRMRWFIMTDMHGVYDTGEQAKQEFEELSELFAGLMNNVIAKDRWVMGWETTNEYFDKNKDWFKSVSDNLNVPALIKLMPEMSHYFAFKNEYQSINSDGSNIQISTVQWDVKNGERFGIGPTIDGKKRPAEVILHASSFGSIERALCSILENTAIDQREGKVPEFPFWLAPSQLRIVPVSESYLDHSIELLNYFDSKKIRTEVDDRNLSVGKKIRLAEKDWVPYIVVIGEKELESKLIPVRVRADKETFETSPEQLYNTIHKRIENFPYERLMLNPLISKRVLFK